MIGKIVRIFLVSLSVLTFSLLLPELYRKAFKQKTERPEVVYSEVMNDFLLVSRTRDSLSNNYLVQAVDSKGNIYDSKELNALTPVRSFKQLEYEQRFPDTICGVPVTTQMLMESFAFPSFLGASGVTKFPFYWMFESDSAKMSVPQDVFRITGRGIEFVNVKENKVDKAKSGLFNEALAGLGFNPPAKNVCGVTSLLKSVDDGYFIIDSNDKLFHIKMASAQPVVNRVELPAGVVPFHMNCMSGSNYFGYFYDTNRNIYLMQKPGYELMRIPIDDYKEFDTMILVESNMFYKTFTLSSASKVKTYILNPDYTLRNMYEQNRVRYTDTKPSLYEGYLFPLVLDVSKDKINFDLNSPKTFIFVSLLLLALLVLLKAYNKRELLHTFNIVDYLFVLVFGIAGFISVLIYPNRK